MLFRKKNKPLFIRGGKLIYITEIEKKVRREENIFVRGNKNQENISFYCL